MSTIKLRSRIGEDGVLHLDIPAQFKDMEVNVTVTVEPVKDNEPSLGEDLTLSEWHQFIAETAGCINEDSFFRHPQGKLQERESLE
jgi:hypothetical protein